MDNRRRDLLVGAVSVALFAAANIVLFLTGRFPVRDGGMPDWTATVGLMAAALMTFAMYSFLYKDNPIFRAAENLFVGLGLGVTFYVIWYQFLKPDIYDRLIVPVFDPAVRVPPADAMLVIPIFLGIMVLTRVSPRYGWISRYPIAFMIGYGAGFSMQPTIHSMILKQVEKTMVPVQMHWAAWLLLLLAVAVVVASSYFASKGGRASTALKAVSGAVVVAYVLLRATPALGDSPVAGEALRGIDSLLIMLGVVCVLCYFFFSAEHKGPLGAAAQVGIIFLMVAFGASFGYTVMARESLVIGRFQFLLGDWLGLLGPGG